MKIDDKLCVKELLHTDSKAELTTVGVLGDTVVTCEQPDRGGGRR